MLVVKSVDPLWNSLPKTDKGTVTPSCATISAETLAKCFTAKVSTLILAESKVSEVMLLALRFDTFASVIASSWTSAVLIGSSLTENVSVVASDSAPIEFIVVTEAT